MALASPLLRMYVNSRCVYNYISIRRLSRLSLAICSLFQDDNQRYVRGLWRPSSSEGPPTVVLSLVVFIDTIVALARHLENAVPMRVRPKLWRIVANRWGMIVGLLSRPFVGPGRSWCPLFSHSATKAIAALMELVSTDPDFGTGFAWPVNAKRIGPLVAWNAQPHRFELNQFWDAGGLWGGHPF